MKNGAGSQHYNAPLLVIASCYNLAALTGALLGMQYYLPTPPMLSDNLIMNDMRYAGAFCGALIGAAGLSLILPRSKIRLTSRSTVPVLLSSTAALCFVLLQKKALLGSATIIALFIPWLIALSLNRRFASREFDRPKS